MKMEKFVCKECDKIFEAKPVKKEYNDPVFGPCVKYVAECLDCKAECSEFVKPKPQKASSQPAMPSCSTGTCGSCPTMN